MPASPVTQTTADAYGNGILAGYLRAFRTNEEPSGTVLTMLWALLGYSFNCYKADLEGHRDEEVFPVYRDEGVLVGRDANKCQLVVQDPTVSNKHCRIYSILYDDQIEPLIYIEDLSSNGTYWNGSLLGRGNEAALLSNGDRIRISARISYTFRAIRTLESEPMDDIQEAEKRLMGHLYRVTERKLGAGAYGHVYLAVSLVQQQQLACKIVNLRKLRLKEEQTEQEQTKGIKRLCGIVPRKSVVDERVLKTFREVEILKDLDHPNIIRLEKVFKSVNTLFIFEELVTGGDLFSYIESKGGHGLLEMDAVVVVHQIVEALKYLHMNGVAHRDLKPDNILMTCSRNPPRVVLTDFGHAIKVACSGSLQRMLTKVGTLDYVAPEVHGKNRTVAQKGYTRAVDMWSLGTVTSAVLTGSSLFSNHRASYRTGSSEKAIIEAAAMCDLHELDHGVQWEPVSDQAKDFVKKLLVLDEKERMSAVQALAHDWLSSKASENSPGALYQQAIKNWKPRCRPPIDLFSDLELYANTQKSYAKSLLPSKKNKAMRPIEPHYQPPHQKLHQLLSQRRQHTMLPSISETSTEPPNIEKLRISEDSQESVEDFISKYSLVTNSQPVLVENASKANSQKPFNEEPPEEIRITNQGLRSKLARPTLSSNRRRSEKCGGPIATTSSRKSERRSIFDMEEDETDLGPVNDTIEIPSSLRPSGFTPINQKRKRNPALEEAMEVIDAPATPLRKETAESLRLSRKRAKKSLDAAQLESRVRADEVSQYWSPSETSSGHSATVRQGQPAPSGVQRSSEQGSTLITPPARVSSHRRIYAPQATDGENDSDVQEIPFRMNSRERPRSRKELRVSSVVNPVEVELHERAGKKTRAFRTAKSYARDVAEMRDKLEAKS